MGGGDVTTTTSLCCLLLLSFNLDVVLFSRDVERDLDNDDDDDAIVIVIGDDVASVDVSVDMGIRILLKNQPTRTCLVFV